MKIQIIKKIIAVTTIIGSFLAFSMASAQLLPPTITIGPSDITQTSGNSVTISGTTSNFTTSTQLKIEYWTGPSVAVYNHIFSSGFTASGSGTFTQTLSGLSPNTTYSFNVVNSANTSLVYPTSQNTFTTQANSVGVPIGTPAPSCTGGATGYCLLAPLGGLTVIPDVDLNSYFGLMYKILIGLAGVLAVVMIFFGGVQYMTSDALGEKEGGREKIRNAVLGLIIALGSYAILNTINPDLLDFTFNVDKLSVNYTPDSHTPQIAVNGKMCVAQGGGYAVGSVWDTSQNETTKRGQLTSLNISIQNPSICVHVGDPSCTSVSDLDLSKATAVRSKCPGCQLILNGGTECWLHSPNTAHARGSSTIDFDDTPTLQAFIQQDTTPTTIPNTPGHKLYTVQGINFVDEGNHIHVNNN
ncbi:MAG: hypothetical protein RL641_318 [Candidatus Parcubacteria bacterium]|jgi:hypothetical protein